MRNKLSITLAVLNQLAPAKRPGIDHAMHNWWMNTREDGGLRLTPAGFKVLSDLDLESWHFDIAPNQLTSKLLLLLDQRLNDPYFLKTDRHKPWIKFYGSKEALLANLYGDLTKFLENYPRLTE